MVPNALFLSSNEDPDSVFNKIKVEVGSANYTYIID